MMNVFSRFVCVLLLLSLVSLAQQKISVSTNRLAVTTGQASDDAITVTFSGGAGHLNAAHRLVCISRRCAGKCGVCRLG